MSFLYILHLSALGASTKQQDQRFAVLPVIHAVAGVVDPHFANAVADAPPVAQPTDAQPIETSDDPSACPTITQSGTIPRGPAGRLRK